MLALRKGVVTGAAEPSAGGIQHLDVEVDGVSRRAYADTSQVGLGEVGDEVVVNTEAVDLKLGSGGRDVVLVNLSRGLIGEADRERHVMKLNYSPLQSGVAPIEPAELLPVNGAAAVFQLHGQLAPVVWAAKLEAPELRIGYVQTGGGALPGGFSRTVSQLIELELLVDHVTAAPAYGAAEAMSTIGGLHAGLAERGWDCAVVGPGPGIIGSGTALGHGGMIALDSLHASLALGLRTVMVVRASNGDPRSRHQGISHHTSSVLDLLLQPVTVGLGPEAPRDETFERHSVIECSPDLQAYAETGLPTRTMGRDLPNDTLFFEQALAGGIALARRAQQD